MPFDLTHIAYSSLYIARPRFLLILHRHLQLLIFELNLWFWNNNVTQYQDFFFFFSTSTRQILQKYIEKNEPATLIKDWLKNCFVAEALIMEMFLILGYVYKCDYKYYWVVSQIIPKSTTINYINPDLQDNWMFKTFV